MIFDNTYYDFFGTTKQIIEQTLATALSLGGDYADMFFEYSKCNEIALRDKQVNNARCDIDFGVGIRVISGEKTGYAYSEITTPEAMRQAAMAAARIANTPGKSPEINIHEINSIQKNYYPILKNWEDQSIPQKKEYLLMLNDLIYQKSEDVINVMGKIADSVTKVLFANSLGESYTDYRPMASAVAIVIMSKGSRIENFYTSKSFRMGAEFLSNELIENLAEDAVKQCNRLFDAERPPCGEMPVVMGAGSSGILLHEAIGHTFEADFNRKNVSIFSDKMGQKICSEQINIVDDGTVPYNRGAVNFDDEGVPGQKTYLVKDGILNSYLHDRISAKFYGVEPTGNGRRESFRHCPIPRMRATYMENGNGTAEDLIKSVSKGIYVDNFSNGQVQIGAGDFTFYVKSGYLIENGKLTRPIKDANIIGNGPEALADIIAVANDSIIDDSTWSCGKGQYCPVSCGMPSVLVKSLNVGGINE